MHINRLYYWFAGWRFIPFVHSIYLASTSISHFIVIENLKAKGSLKLFHCLTGLQFTTII